MLLNTEELLALVHGDVEPDRLADLLDRLERCPDSSEALRTLVTLRANRGQALATLRAAADADQANPTPFPQPEALPAPHPAWARRGLQLAASVALATMVGVWAMSIGMQPQGPADSADLTWLATAEETNVYARGPRGVELTADGDDPLDVAAQMIDQRRYEEARELLEDLETDDPAGPMFLGVAQYWLGNYEEALEALSPLRDRDVGNSLVSRQARWFEANTLIKLQRPVAAFILLEELRAAPASRVYQPEADALYTKLAASRLGIPGGDPESPR